MHLIISQEKLRNALSKVLAVVDKKSIQMSYYYNKASQGMILMEAKDGKLIISATDVEVSIKINVECKIVEEGTLSLAPKNLFFLIKELPDKEVTIFVDKNSENAEGIVNIKCANSSYSLVLSDYENFTMPPDTSDENPFELPTDLFSNVIGKTIGSMSTDDTRAYLNGVFFQQVNGSLRAVSTDGFYLTLIEIGIIEEAFKSLIEGVIIPRKGVLELKRLADTFPGDKLSLIVDDSYIRANVNQCYFVTVLLMAREYPKYQAVIPSKTEFAFTIDRELFLNAIRRIKIMCSDRTNKIKLTIDTNNITVVARHPSIGYAEEKISCQYSGEKIDIAFNASYLLDVLSNFEGSQIIFEFNNEEAPVVVKNPEALNYFSIICPLKLEYF